MKILVLTSRYTASRDIIGEDFGRQTRLFEALAKLKNNIDFFCADYNKFESRDTNLHGIKVFIRPFGAFHFFGFLRNLSSTLKNNKYDAVLATSDPLWGVIGYFFAKKHGLKFIYDLHDNYETYATYRIPFLKQLDRHAVRNADIVTTVSHALKNKISKIRKKNVFVIQNGVDLRLFRPMDKKASRIKLKIEPYDKKSKDGNHSKIKNIKIIGYTGSLQKSLGVHILINVFEKLRKEIPELRLLLAGRISKNKKDAPDIKKPGIIHLDLPSQKDVALAINACDVVVIPSPSNEFTRYCFPYKCVEYMACNTPIVATSLSDVKLMLKDYDESLCEPDNEDELYTKIKSQLSKGKIDYRKKLNGQTWDNIALKLDNTLKKITLKK